LWCNKKDRALRRPYDMAKNYTVEDVMNLFTKTVTDNMAATAKGQAHLNRIGKAITNESIEARKKSSYETYAQKAFEKRHSELSKSDPEKAQAFAAKEREWKDSYIKRNYLDQDEEF